MLVLQQCVRNLRGVRRATRHVWIILTSIRWRKRNLAITPSWWKDSWTCVWLMSSAVFSRFRPLSVNLQSNPEVWDFQCSSLLSIDEFEYKTNRSSRLPYIPNQYDYSFWGLLARKKGISDLTAALRTSVLIVFIAATKQ